MWRDPAIDAPGRQVERGLLLLLLLPVPCLLVAHTLHQEGIGAFTSDRWDVDVDRGWMEVLGYGYVISAALLLAVLASAKRGAPVHATWAFALTLLVLDDALEGHESGGEWLDARFALRDLPGLRTQDIGELLVWGCLGAVVVGVLAWGHRRSPDGNRGESWCLAGLVGMLTVFAVGVDMVHIVIANLTSSYEVELLITSLEAGGELTAMAALMAYVVHLGRSTTGGRRPCPDGDHAIDLRDSSPPHHQRPQDAASRV